MKYSKFNSRKCFYDDIEFDSRKEKDRYIELKILERSGEISDLKLQKRYILIPKQSEPDRIGKRGGVYPGAVIERECDYYADFVYTDKYGNTVVEDVKSPATRTKDYVIKRKLMLYVHGIRIKEV